MAVHRSAAFRHVVTAHQLGEIYAYSMFLALAWSNLYYIVIYVYFLFMYSSIKKDCLFPMWEWTASRAWG